jgi:hypothetical protein
MAVQFGHAAKGPPCVGPSMSLNVLTVSSFFKKEGGKLLYIQFAARISAWVPGNPWRSTALGSETRALTVASVIGWSDEPLALYTSLSHLT